MIHIVGAGMGGTYLGKLFLDEGIDFKIYEKRGKPLCHCAWGIMYDLAKKYAKRIGYDFEEYIISKPSRVIINGVETKMENVVIFDRPRWLSDLWKDLESNIVLRYKYSEGDMDGANLIVDATGTSRYVMEMVGNRITEDRFLFTIEKRIIVDDLDSDYVYIYGRPYGYAWLFPLGDRDWHFGAGAPTQDQVYKLMSGLIEMTHLYRYGIDCLCKPKIRYIIPRELNIIHLRPYVAAIGEAGGFVSGFGEGNLLAMETAEILYKCLGWNYYNVENSLYCYRYYVMEKMKWIRYQHEMIKAMNKNILYVIPKLPKVLKIAKQRSRIKVNPIKMIKILWRVLRGEYK